MSVVSQENCAASLMLLKQLDLLYYIRWFRCVLLPLQAFSFLSCDTLFASLKCELPTYLGRASKMATEVDPPLYGASRFQSCKLGKYLSSSCANSALVSRNRMHFSLLTNSFGANQDLALQDYIESSLMLQYNPSIQVMYCCCFLQNSLSSGYIENNRWLF